MSRQHHCEDILLQALQLKVLRGILCGCHSDDPLNSVISLFAGAADTVIGSCFFVIDERSCYHCPRRKEKVIADHFLVTISEKDKKGRPYMINACDCLVCTHQVPWTEAEIYSSNCRHADFWSIARQFSTVQSFANWLIQNSFPYIPLFGLEAQALVAIQSPDCRTEAESGVERTLLAPPESLSDL